MKIKTRFLPFDVSISRKRAQNQSKVVSKIVKRDYNKIFGIGFNKTGTTSLEKLLLTFGFSVGNQAAAETLAEDWLVHQRTERIIRFCHTADAFEDIPFAFPNIYKELDQAFPNSKFILTVRDSPEQWFASLRNFHTKKFSSDKSRPPSAADLANSSYRYKGFMMDWARTVWNYPAIPLYDEVSYKNEYLKHIQDATNYFDGTDRLIQVNVANNNDLIRLCSFLNVQTTLKEFPWENKT